MLLHHVLSSRQRVYLDLPRADTCLVRIPAQNLSARVGDT